MLIVSEIIERLKDVLSCDGKNGKVFDKDVANALGLSQVNFATMKNRNKIPFASVLDFCALKKISINWLLYNQNPNSLLDATDKYWIRYYPSIQMLGGKNNLKNIEAINVIGDSMEPTLNSDNIIFLDISKKDFSKEGIYAFTTTHGLFVKRIQRRVDGKLDIISDNKEYPVQVVAKHDISIVGKVVGSFGMVF
jgi:hypothetical protein